VDEVVEDIVRKGLDVFDYQHDWLSRGSHSFTVQDLKYTEEGLFDDQVAFAGLILPALC